MLQAMKPLAHTMHLSSPNIERASPTVTLESIVEHHGFQRILTYATIADAVRGAMTQGPTLICGSFHVADEALSVL